MSFNPPSSRTEPSWSEADAAPERLVVWAFRHWICGHVEGRSVHWSMVWQCMSEWCGSPDGARAVAALEGLVRVICLHAERPVLYHQPPCACLGKDERKLVELLAACQLRQWRNAASLAREFVGEDGVGDLIEVAARLARLLAEHGQHIAAAGREPRAAIHAAVMPSRRAH